MAVKSSPPPVSVQNVICFDRQRAVLRVLSRDYPFKGYMVIVWANKYLRAVSTMYKIHFSSFLKQISRCYTKFYFLKDGGGH
jgi:hypothetical protein